MELVALWAMDWPAERTASFGWYRLLFGEALGGRLRCSAEICPSISIHDGNGPVRDGLEEAIRGLRDAVGRRCRRWCDTRQRIRLPLRRASSVKRMMERIVRKAFTAATPMGDALGDGDG